jgi:type VI protein secretion system component VasK
MRSTKSILCVAALLLVSVAAYAYVPDQPRMQAARADLQAARAQLRNATNDKGGHRARALDQVDEALTEVNAGIRFDRRHDEESALPDQPHMQAALDKLQSARANLEAASDDKGGHRVKALDHVKRAIEDVKKGIDYDRTH